MSEVLTRHSVQELRHYAETLPQYEPETRHHFHGGLYCREFEMGQGALVVGRVHRKDHFFQVVSGTIRVTQEGEPAKEYTGPALVKSNPGTQRAIFAMTPSLCMTIHATSATTPEEAEVELVEEDPNSLFDARNRVKPGVLKIERQEVLK